MPARTWWVLTLLTAVVLEAGPPGEEPAGPADDLRAAGDSGRRAGLAPRVHRHGDARRTDDVEHPGDLQGRQACEQPMVSAELVEAQIATYVGGMRLPPECLGEVVAELRQRRGSPGAGTSMRAWYGGSSSGGSGCTPGRDRRADVSPGGGAAQEAACGDGAAGGGPGR